MSAPRRLVDLDPGWIGSGGEGVSRLNPATGTYEPAPRREGVGLICRCPGCGADWESETCGRLYVPFANPLDGGPQEDRQGWQRTGDTFEALTLSPSVQRGGRSCGWHGFIRNGHIETC